MGGCAFRIASFAPFRWDRADFLALRKDGECGEELALTYEMATEQAQEFANVLHVWTLPTRRRLVLIKKTPKGRVRQTRFGLRCHSKLSLQIAKREGEPWLLACSAGLAHLSPSAVVTLYAQRMRIEQSFHDTKNPQLGMGLSDARSRSARRIQNAVDDRSSGQLATQTDWRKRSTKAVALSVSEYLP